MPAYLSACTYSYSVFQYGVVTNMTVCHNQTMLADSGVVDRTGVDCDELSDPGALVYLHAIV
jgi:hypothetical protein